jgi:4-hydroxy-tetrahydrodipicolinate reductase
MGSTLTRLIAAGDAFELAGAATEPGHESVGEAAGVVAGIGRLGVPISDRAGDAVADCDVAVDFTLPAAALGNIDACLARQCALVMGTTGLSREQHAALGKAGQAIGVLYGRNMSIGVNVFTELVRLAVRGLGPGYDVEISEAHHRSKVDAPSGTALQLGDTIAAELGTRLEEVAIYDRHGATGARKAGTIGFSCIRAGGIVGDHTVLLAADEELIRLQHSALDRASVARGALRAAQWLAGQPPGLYNMGDVLGFSR